MVVKTAQPAIPRSIGVADALFANDLGDTRRNRRGKNDRYRSLWQTPKLVTGGERRLRSDARLYLNAEAEPCFLGNGIYGQVVTWICRRVDRLRVHAKVRQPLKDAAKNAVGLALQ